jgi:HSP20 family protein
MFNRKATTDTQGQHWHHEQWQNCGGFGKMFSNKAQRMNEFFGNIGNRKSANIEENEASFTISLYAAGLNKNNFKVSATEDVLSITYTAPATTEETKSNYIHREYEPGSFNRSFQLNGKVLTENISATYTDGVLKVTLLKNPETNKPAQEVNVD